MANQNQHVAKLADALTAIGDARQALAKEREKLAKLQAASEQRQAGLATVLGEHVAALTQLGLNATGVAQMTGLTPGEVKDALKAAADRPPADAPTPGPEEDGSW
jgi:septal ring factor EnvC (AmiA/AmiB activator)